MPAETRELTIKLPKLKKVLKSTLDEAYTMSGESIGLRVVDIDNILYEICLAAGVEPTRAMKKAVKKAQDTAKAKALEDFKNEQNDERPVLSDNDEDEDEDELEEETPQNTSPFTIGQRVLVNHFAWRGEGVITEISAGMLNNHIDVRMETGTHAGQTGLFYPTELTSL